MTVSQLGLIALSFLIGLIFLSAVNRVYWAVALLAPTDGCDNKSQAFIFLAAIAASSVAAVIVLGPLYAFGYIPLCERTPFFGWPFAFALLLARSWQWWKKPNPREIPRV